MTDDELRNNLKHVFDYDKNTGVFRWKIRGGANVPIGKVAGKTDSYGYIQLTYKLKSYLAHRVAWLFEYGYWPKNQIDHIDRNKKNNSIFNLRDVSRNVNQHNRVEPLSNGTSGFLGVSFHKKSGKFQSNIVVNNKQIYLGLFDTPEAAHKAYLEEKSKRHHTFTF